LSLRPHDPTAPIPVPVNNKRKEELSDRAKEKKKAKGEKWMASQKEKADEARAVQNSWQKFGKKAAKKGIHIAGLEGKSVFRTGDSAASELQTEKTY
jgi:survival-of-motor-neuron-related-splicing factor 30